MSGRIARPQRRGQGFDERPQRGGLGRQFFVTRHQFDELALDAAGIFETKHGAAANGAALHFDRMTRQHRQRHRKCFAARAQRVDGMLYRGGFAGIEPVSERQHAMRGSYSENARIAVNGGLVRAGRPVDHYLWLGEQQRVGAIEFGAQICDLVARPRFQPRRPRPRANEQDRGDDGKQDDAANQSEECDLVPIDAAVRAENEFLQRQRRLLGGARWRQAGGQEADNGGKESANSLSVPP